MDSKYFEQIYEQTNNNFKYTAYKPKYSAIVLYSKEGIPLASLQINCPNKDANSILTRRPEKMDNLCQFQCIITEDNKEFQLIISNFTDKKISFNISNYDVIKKSPSLQQLNEINILNKYQSVSVKSDYTKDNAALILSAIKETVNNKTTNVSVEKSEKKENVGNYDSSYISLQIYPEKVNDEFSSKFIDAKWAEVDVVVMAKENDPPLTSSGDRIIIPQSYHPFYQPDTFINEGFHRDSILSNNTRNRNEILNQSLNNLSNMFKD